MIRNFFEMASVKSKVKGRQRIHIQCSKSTSTNVGVLSGKGIQKCEGKRKEAKERLNVDFESLNEMLVKIDSIPLDTDTIHSIPSTLFNQPINTKCSCGNIGNQKSQIAGGKSLSSDSDTDDEDEISIGKIIDMLNVHTRKALQKDRSPVLTNLVSGFRPGNETLHAVQLQQLKLLLNGNSNTVKSCVLVLLAKLSAIMANAKAIFEAGFLEKLVKVVEEQDILLLKDALHCIGMLISHEELCDSWLLLMIQRGLPSLLTILQSNIGENLLVSTGSVLSVLAVRHEIAVLLVDHGMPVIIGALQLISKLREPVITMLTHVISHNDQLMAAVIDNYVFREIDMAFRVDLCSEQIAAMGFCYKLCQDSYGIASILEEDKLKLLVQVTQATNCVKVRGLGVKMIHALLKCQETNILKESIVQMGRIHCEGNNLRGMADVKLMQKHTSLGMKRQETKSRTERGVMFLSKMLINLLYREGKVIVDSDGKVQSVGFKAAHDPYSTMSVLVACFYLISTLPLSRSRTRTTSSNKVLFQCFSSKHRKVNLNTSTYLIQNGALNVIHILNSYCNLLGDGRRTRQATASERSLDTLHLQAIMKIWQKEEQEQTPPLNLADVLVPSELKFLLEMLSLMKLFSQICSTEWNYNVKDKLQEAIAVDQEVGKSYYDAPVDQYAPHLIGDLKIRSTGEETMPAITVKEVLDSGDGLMEIQAVEMNANPDGAGLITKRIAWEESEERREVSESIDEGTINTFERPLLETLNEAGYDVKADDSVFELHQKLRMKLCQEGLFDALMSLARCGVPQLEEEILETLKCLLQPVKPPKLTDHHDSKSPLVKQKTLEEISKSLEMRDRLLSSVINSMSKKTADVMKEALKTDSRKKSSKTVGNKKKVDAKQLSNFRTSITNSPERLSWHCTMHCLEMAGHVIKGLTDREDGAVQRLLLILYDMLSFGDITVHMKLASIGLIPALLEFICKEHPNMFISLLAVIVLQKLTHDLRLKEMCKTEGSFYELKMKFSSTYRGILKRELQFFFKRVEIPTDSLGLDIKVGYPST
ncbi:uncharacterized protein LOC117112715 isoform X2 [Anneissia japonica]|uniref:uncharacterized protein LOC117112715 isoform X2 n=1 Tax=Anneissia japonica TaxID=1529436 RepID=UPI0014259F6F|nr:uncharacterized protein LOC117112715 isoform X2 [Anneissia japonica]